MDIRRAAKISVVIPTYGRVSLNDSIESATFQSLKPSEILVVVDESKAEISSVSTSITNHSLIRVIPSKGAGPASARNTGILESKYEYIAFLDDDDIWIESKLESQMNMINSLHLSPKDYFVLSSSALYVTENYAIGQPNNLYTGSRFLESLYKLTWRKTTSCIPTPTILIPTTLAKMNLFDEDLYLREDIHWLSNVEANGARIIQTSEALVLVNYEPDRSRSNESIKNVWKSFGKFYSINRKASFYFLFGVGLRSLLLKNYSKVKEYIKRRKQK